MNDVSDTLDAWKNQTISRSALLRRLLQYENWMMPCNSGVDSFGPFTLGLPRLIAEPGGQSHLYLFADGDAQEALAVQHDATGGMGFANPTGWHVFSIALDGVDAVVCDPGTEREFTIVAAEFAEVAELAAAVATELAWQRLRTGREKEGDLGRIAHYAGYHLAVVQHEEGAAFVHVPHDDGGMFVPVFTHEDALALALDEFRENFAPAELRTVRVGGEKAFPVLANEVAAGFVLNYRGPGEPMAFQMGLTQLLLEELAKSPAAPPPPATP